MTHILFNMNWSRALSLVGGFVWSIIEPTLPFAALCLFAMLADCISAIRLNRRVRKRYGKKASDGKIKSQHMSKMMGSMMMLFSVMFIAQGVNMYVITSWDIPLGNCVAGMFLIYTILSILENESSCNGSKWALLLQKFIADKTKRHLDVDIYSLMSEQSKQAGEYIRQNNEDATTQTQNKIQEDEDY